MLGAMVKLLLFAVIVNPNFLSQLSRSTQKTEHAARKVSGKPFTDEELIISQNPKLTK